MNYYLIAGIIVLICIVAIIFALRVLKDTRKMQSGKLEEDDDSDDLTTNF